MLGCVTSLLATTHAERIALWLLLIPWILLVVYALIDLFRKSGYSGGAKIGWLVAIVVFPFFGSITYVVIRGTQRMRSRGR